MPETVLINPKIEYLPPDMEEGWEGCLSVPGMRGVVSRYAKVRYSGFDQYGEKIDRVADGFHARVVQHEYDHLIGKLYPMRITDFTRFGFTEVLFPGPIRLPTIDWPALPASQTEKPACAGFSLRGAHVGARDQNVSSADR